MDGCNGFQSDLIELGFDPTETVTDVLLAGATTYTAKVTAWHKITVIGGGSDGQNALALQRGGYGGNSAVPIVGYLYLEAGQTYAVFVADRQTPGQQTYFIDAVTLYSDSANSANSNTKSTGGGTAAVEGDEGGLGDHHNLSLTGFVSFGAKGGKGDGARGFGSGGRPGGPLSAISIASAIDASGKGSGGGGGGENLSVVVPGSDGTAGAIYIERPRV